jgi:two-component system, OmpR family, alkaline phosphatase synthesis response regulator PhoP
MPTKKILIIDDEQDVIKLLSYRLKIYGYTTISSSNGKLGINKAKKEIPHLIILDIMMPELDGFEVAKELKSKTETKDIPVVFLTASNASNIPRKVAKISGATLFYKPYNHKKLIATIKALTN